MNTEQPKKKKRPKDDALKPRAPRTDGGFREAKEFVKEKEETLKFDLPKPEAKEKKLLSNNHNRVKERAKEEERKKRKQK